MGHLHKLWRTHHIKYITNELQYYQTQSGKSKIKISLCQNKIYQRTDLEGIRTIFDQVLPLVSHIEVYLPEKKLNLNNIGESLKDPQHQLQKEFLFVNYDNKENVKLILDSIPIKSLPGRIEFLLSLRKSGLIIPFVSSFYMMELGTILQSLLNM